MGTETMGKVLVAATVENLDDLFAACKGQVTEGQVRRVEVTDALVDTGATGLLLPGGRSPSWAWSRCASGRPGRSPGTRRSRSIGRSG